MPQLSLLHENFSDKGIQQISSSLHNRQSIVPVPCEEPLVSHLSVCPVSSLVLCMSRICGGNIQQMESWHLKPFRLPLCCGERLYIEEGLHVEDLNSHFPVTANGSFCRCCRCMRLVRTCPCNKILAYSTTDVEILNLISLCQTKSSLWFHCAWRFSESLAGSNPTWYVSSLT